MAIDGAPSALLGGAPSARLPESEAGVESEAGTPEACNLGSYMLIKTAAEGAGTLVWGARGGASRGA